MIMLIILVVTDNVLIPDDQSQNYLGIFFLSKESKNPR